MRHNDMLDLLGHCLCPCHASNHRPGDEVRACWCRSRVPADDGLALHHNDRVRFGSCTCPHHHQSGSGCCCARPTGAAFATALRRLDARDTERRRIRQGIVTDVRRPV